MSKILYGDPFSASTRLVTLTADILGLDLDFRHVDVMKGDHLKTSFTKINPLQSVPVLIDHTLTLTEGRAIALFLVNHYGREAHVLYPSNNLDRAKVDEMLFYCASTFSRIYQQLMSPLLNDDKIGEEELNKMLRLLHWLNKRVGNDGFVAETEQISVADLDFFAITSTLQAVDNLISFSTYPHVLNWSKRVQESVPNYKKANGNGVNRVAAFCRERRI